MTKRTGCCVLCETPCYEIREVYTSGPLEGHARRLGPMLDSGTQVTFLLANGSTADVTFCDDCARTLTPEQYRAVWLACVERTDLSLRLAGRGENERTIARAQMLAAYPVGVVGRRRESEPGILAVDRRG